MRSAGDSDQDLPGTRRLTSQPSPASRLAALKLASYTIGAVLITLASSIEWIIRAIQRTERAWCIFYTQPTGGRRRAVRRSVGGADIHRERTRRNLESQRHRARPRADTSGVDDDGEEQGRCGASDSRWNDQGGGAGVAYPISTPEMLDSPTQPASRPHRPRRPRPQRARPVLSLSRLSLVFGESG